MIDKFIKYIVSKTTLFQHSLELRRIELSKDQIDFGLYKLYKQYLNKVICGEVFPRSKFGYSGGFSINYENIFKNYKLKNPELSQEEEKCLEHMLTGNISKWFVPYVLREYDTKSLDLMKKLIETGIKQNDPSYNSIFLLEALRIYGAPVNDYLLQRFKDSRMDIKRGIFRALYWLEPKFTDKQKAKKIELFLNEFLLTKNKRLKSYLSLNLPTEIELYPIELKNKAEQFLKLVDKETASA